MGLESHNDYFSKEWSDHLDKTYESISNIPDDLIYNGPSFEKETKTGEKINATIEYNYFTFGDNYSDRVPSNPPGNGIMHYLFARDKDGEIVGTRISTIYEEGQKLLVRSLIRVRDRGKGMASPIEEAFIDSLQWLADTQNKKVIWEVTNENLDNLLKYKEQPDADPATIKTLEIEQQRWQYLYGNGGKFGITDGKKIFEPSNKTQ